MSQCEQQQRWIANTFNELKKESDSGAPNVRLGYMEFGSTQNKIDDNIVTVVSLVDPQYNGYHRNITVHDIADYFNIIDGRCDDLTEHDLNSRTGNPNLMGGVKYALKQFGLGPTSSDLGRDKKILIFSNCEATNIQGICEKYEDTIRIGSKKRFRWDGYNGYNVIMVNIGDQISNPETYAMCMVEYDPMRIFYDIDRNDEIFNDEIVANIQEEICSNPTSTPTTDPTYDPTNDPTQQPTTSSPSEYPTDIPSIMPTKYPTKIPTDIPTDDPSLQPTDVPSDSPTDIPTDNPTESPSEIPTNSPSDIPTDGPSRSPTKNPTNSPSDIPTDGPSRSPTKHPTQSPTDVPSDTPSTSPTDQPSDGPSQYPSGSPSKTPTNIPTEQPSNDPTKSPTDIPSKSPSKSPTEQPTVNPSDSPTNMPTHIPSNDPSTSPTNFPSVTPTDTPTDSPTELPSISPTIADCDDQDQLLDVVLLADVSSPMTYQQCKVQQHEIADVMKSFKYEDPNKMIADIRISYIEFGSQNVFQFVSLTQAPYNSFTGLIEYNIVDELHELIRDAGRCDKETEQQLLSRNGEPNLFDALGCAIEQLISSSSTASDRDRYIVIFSNSAATDRDAICSQYAALIRQENIKVIMYNQGNNELDNYAICLVQNTNYIFNNPSRNNYQFIQHILPNIRSRVCNKHD